jgi:DNA-binding NtrC family response regulator
VLIVEDEYFIADDMAQALRELGAEVVGPVPNLTRAAAFIAANDRIDAAVLDINLAGESVFPIADMLADRGVPFVFATGYDQSALPPSYGRVLRWEKPFNPEDLARTLPRLLERAA